MSKTSTHNFSFCFQAGPVNKVTIPLNRDTKKQANFCFIEFRHEETVPYAINLFKDVRLFGRSLQMQNKTTGAGMPSSQDQNRHQRSLTTLTHHLMRPIFKSCFFYRTLSAPNPMVPPNHGFVPPFQQGFAPPAFNAQAMVQQQQQMYMRQQENYQRHDNRRHPYENQQNYNQHRNYDRNSDRNMHHDFRNRNDSNSRDRSRSYDRRYDNYNNDSRASRQPRRR